MALTATDGQTRTSHHDACRPLRIRYEQKLEKYSNAAQTLGYRLIPCGFSYADQIHHVIEGFVHEQIRLKLQIADGQEDSTKLKVIVKHWSQQMSAAINREASRNIIRKASQMVNANATQRQASAAIDSGDDFSHKSIQAINNCDIFDF